MTCSAARMRSVAMNRSATMPTKNGEIIAASAVVPAASPICSPEKCSVAPSHVPMVTYHAPQTKYWRNIIADSLIRVAEFNRNLALGPPRRNRLLRQNDARQHIHRRLQPFVPRCKSVFVLDAHHVVVLDQPQRGDNALPLELVMPPADAAEQPRSLGHAVV